MGKKADLQGRSDRKVIINPDIRIQLGKRLELEKTIEKEDRNKHVNASSRPLGNIIPDYSFFATDGLDSGMKMEKINYKLVQKDDDLFFKNQGLCRTYGIIGIPGCGKTYLLKHLLTQIVGQDINRPDYKFGGLILDPKCALLEDIKQVMKESGRSDDLLVINTDELKNDVNKYINPIDTFIKPIDLGKLLVLSANSAGFSGKDPYWHLQMSEVFGATLYVLGKVYKTKPSLKLLLDTIFSSKKVDGEPGITETRYISELSILVKQAESIMEDLDADTKNDLKNNIEILERFIRNDEREVIADFMSQAFSVFRLSDNKCYSKLSKEDSTEVNLYDQIIEQGKIVLISLSPSDLVLSKILCTLVKCIFQVNLLSRLARYNAKTIKNYTRPVLFVADEYSDVATDLVGQPVGDSTFFQKLRQYGGLALLATQSISALRKALGNDDAYKAILGSFEATIYMTLNDLDTIDIANASVGKDEYNVKITSTTLSGNNISENINWDIREKDGLPAKILTQELKQGQAVVIGSLDGGDSRDLKFVKVDGGFSQQSK